MTFLKKKPLVALVLGLVLTVIGVLALVLDFNDSSNELFRYIFTFILAILLLLVGIYIVYPDFAKTKHNGLKVLFAIELILIIWASVVGLILPLFIDNLSSLGNANLWFGIILVAHGTINLYAGTHSLKTIKGLSFFFNWLLIVLGVTVYLKSLVTGELKTIAAISFIALGVVLLFIWIQNKKK